MYYISILIKIIINKYIKIKTTLYNEERRLRDETGSDTLVLLVFTSNDGLSIAFFFTSSQPTNLWLVALFFNHYFIY